MNTLDENLYLVTTSVRKKIDFHNQYVEQDWKKSNLNNSIRRKIDLHYQSVEQDLTKTDLCYKHSRSRIASPAYYLSGLRYARKYQHRFYNVIRHQVPFNLVTKNTVESHPIPNSSYTPLKTHTHKGNVFVDDSLSIQIS